MTARRRTVLAALERALKELDAPPEDEAAVQLARRYAADLDEAEVLSVAAAKLLREVEGVLDEAQLDRLYALAARIERTAVLALLGPKLVQVLAELNLTTRARADVTGKGGGGGQPPRNELAEWRAERNKRFRTP